MPSLHLQASRTARFGLGHLHGCCAPQASVQYSTMSGQESSYSIWLIPDPAEEFYKRVETEIQHWAPKHNGPLFPPHVTLIGGIKGTQEDVLAKSEGLAKQLQVRFC